MFDPSLVARCLEESSERAVKDTIVEDSLLLAQLVDSMSRREVHMPKEEIAWADSCVEYPGILDGDWSFMKESMLEILNSPHDDQLQISTAKSNGYPLNTDIEMLPSNRGIVNARGHHFISSAEETGRRADHMLIDEKVDDYDLKPCQGSLTNDMYSDQDIFSTWDLNIPATENELIKLFNEILAESSFKSVPSTFHESRKLRYLEEAFPERLSSTLAAMSLNRNN